MDKVSPGDRREDHATGAGEAAAAIYAQAELIIIAAIAALARKTAAGVMLPQIAARKAAQTVSSVLSSIAPRVRAVLDDAMQGASEQAAATVTTAMPPPAQPVPAAAAAAPPAAAQPPAAPPAQPPAPADPALAVPDSAPDPGEWTRPLAALLDQAGDNAVQAADTAFAGVADAVHQVPATPPPPVTAAPARAAVPAAPRIALPPASPPENPYQAATGRAFGEHAGWPGSTLSYRRIQAAQAALDDLASQGITGFTDSAGRNWDLASYVEMATRTAVSNAWDDMQARAAIRAGIDLVETGTHSTEGSCPLCIPWLGKTLSLTGATPGYKTVAEAKAAGWRHPSCRCFWTPTGFTADVTNPVDPADAARVYEASQRQRALERRVRAAGRRYQAAITPQAKTRARRDLAAARAASAAHRQQHGLRIMKVTVQRRERPFGPR